MVFPLDSDIHYIPFIERVMPELQIRKFKLNSDGLANDVMVVNDEFVFRFAKGEFGRTSLARELQVLEAVRGRAGLPIPEPVYTSELIIAYRLLAGESFTHRWMAVLSSEERNAAASQLAGFLRSMHAVQESVLPLTAAPVSAGSFEDQRQRARLQIYPLLLPHQVEWAEQVYAFIDEPDVFVFQPVLIHGDLAPYHILIEPGSHRLSGVIDFGVSGLGDPASDLGSLLQYYGSDFVQLVIDAYPALSSYMPRARFYAQAIEIQWVLRGLESGESFWYTAHLGGWRGLD